MKIQGFCASDEFATSQYGVGVDYHIVAPGIRYGLMHLSAVVTLQYSTVYVNE